MINPSIFKAYDIRGVYPKDINEENIVDISKAIYTFFVKELKKDNLTIVLGRDMRISSPSLFEAVKKILVDFGATVIDIGLASTPTVYFATIHGKYDAGIQVSASHNPKEYAGLKFFLRVGDKLNKVSKSYGMEEIKNLCEIKNFVSHFGRGTVIKKENILLDEIHYAKDLVKLDLNTTFKVVCDAANAMGSVFVTKLFEELPIDLIKMNFELDGTFPVHQPDPLQFKLHGELQKRVLSEKADFGIFPDGDGDRIFFINELGEIVPATHISALIASELFRDNPKAKIIVDVRYIGNVKNLCQRYNTFPSYSRVGHALITAQLNFENADFAGESSGHYYFKETGGAESSMRVILYVLKILAREKKTLSQVLQNLVTSVESGEYNFELVGVTAKNMLDHIVSAYSDGILSTLDGIAIEFSDWRMSIRTSNTESLLRLNVEGTTQKLVNQKLEELKLKIISLGAKLKE
jgi:phosphomannomutase